MISILVIRRTYPFSITFFICGIIEFSTKHTSGKAVNYVIFTRTLDNEKTTEIRIANNYKN